MQIVVRKYPDRKKPCLVLEQGNKGVVLANFRNEEMMKLYFEALGGTYMIEILNDHRSIEKLLEVIQNADSD